MPRFPSDTTLEPGELERGLEVARRLRVAVFVVAYNAEREIESTLRRIPAALLPLLADLFVIDDSSQDATTSVARRLAADLPPLTVFRTPFNQGYGGNQMLGYRYAIERGHDIVILLHGDGQYAPEVMPRLLAPFASPDVDCVMGSRMLRGGAARRGGMPLYKRLGNRVLSLLENRLLGTHLSEFHSGYRAYRVATLAQLPFEHNTKDFHFDTEIIVQHLMRGARIVEVPIPTYYGDEICHVNGIPYAWHCIETILHAKANRLYLLYHPKFDVGGRREPYRFKQAPNSLHQHILAESLPSSLKLIEIGASGGDIAAGFHARGHSVVAVDREPPFETPPFPYLELDLDAGFADHVLAALGGRADRAIALDVLEHMYDPEASLAELKRVLKPGARLVASTGNIAYLPLRLALAAGQFNYGKRGILDLTHRRLFTLRSFKRMLTGAGFRVERTWGFGPPVRDMVGGGSALRLLDAFLGWLARLRPELFGYQFLVEATRLDTVEELLELTLESSAGAPRPTPGAAREKEPRRAASDAVGRRSGTAKQTQA